MTLAELGMPTVPTLLPVPQIGSAVTPEGEDTSEFLGKAMGEFLDELTWWAEAARARKAAVGTP